MKKYIMKQSAQELTFGDIIELDLTKDLPNGKTKHQHMECKFIPELIPILLANDIIAEKEVPGETPQVEFDDDIDNGECEFCNLLLEKLNTLIFKIDALNQNIEKLNTK